MASRGSFNQNDSVSTPVRHKTPPRLSPRAKWKRAARKKLGKSVTSDVDRESVPLSEKESLSRQNSMIQSRNSSAKIRASHMPNAVPHDQSESDSVVDQPVDITTEDNLSKTLDSNSAKCETITILSDRTGTETDFKNSPSKEQNTIDENEVIPLSNKGPVVEITNLTKENVKENGFLKLNGSIIHSDINNQNKVPFCKLDNDVPLKESLTVPGAEPDSSGSKDGELQIRKGSVFSHGREGTRLSIDSRKSIDARVQYTTVQMPQTEEKVKAAMFTPEDSWIKTVIPYMPLGVAITCLILNIIIPGSGTILSGVTIFCCGESRVPQKYGQDAIMIMCLNTWVGVAQLFTVTFMFVGWFWSLAWGITMVILSVEHRREQKEQRAKEMAKRALEAFGTSLPGRVSALA